MPVYQYEGKHYDLPDGLSNEQAIAKIQGYLGKTVTPEPVATPVSNLELMFGAGSPIARTIKGAVVDPALAVNQLLASTGLFGKDIKRGATQLVSDVEQATTEGRARVGSSGFDPYQTLGNVISPVNRLVGVTQAPLQGAGLMANIARSGSTLVLF